MTPLLDSLTYVGIVMLILSQISEKITTFIRSYLRANEENLAIGRKKRSLKQKFNIGFRQLLSCLLLLDNNGKDKVLPRDKKYPAEAINKSQIKQETTEEGKVQVEFAITKLSLLIGFIIAVSFHADLFAIFNSTTPETVLTWNNVHLEFNFELLKTLFGCLCTAFLLSFGSKFFHDFLEIIYEIKLNKRRLTDPATYKSGDFVTLEERLKTTYFDPVWLTFERHKTILMERFKSVVTIERVFDSIGNSYLEIRLKENNDDFDKLQKYVFDYVVAGKSQVLHPSFIRIIANNKPVVAHVKTHLIGEEVDDTIELKTSGTLGFFAYEATKTAYDNNSKPTHFVTCAHVVTKKGDKVFGKKTESDEKHELGEVVEYFRNEWMDAALIKLNDDIVGKNILSTSKTMRLPVRDLSSKEKIEVWVDGAASDPMNGIVRSIENLIRVEYDDKIIELNDLIRISAINSNGTPIDSPISNKGDSGAVVFDTEMHPVGIIIAGSNLYSYAVPISRIENWLNIKVSDPNWLDT
jgi:hypothetical protein